MIALAMIDRDLAAPGTPLLIRRIARSGVQNIPARVVTLPFLR
jgi:glycine cleavage system aminomethyltransferase T